jgi:hypothetical protein
MFVVISERFNRVQTCRWSGATPWSSTNSESRKCALVSVVSLFSDDPCIAQWNKLHVQSEFIWVLMMARMCFAHLWFEQICCSTVNKYSYRFNGTWWTILANISALYHIHIDYELRLRRTWVRPPEKYHFAVRRRWCVVEFHMQI